MRLYELAYCCDVFVRAWGSDEATVELREATGPAIDPSKPEHVGPLLTWLRRWGGRQFASEDEGIAAASLAEWWSAWSRRLPPLERVIDALDEAELDAIAAAYDELRTRQASWQRKRTGRVAKTFGATGAAKALYALRPQACAPWDDAIRKHFGLPVTGEGYRRHLVRVREELAEALGDVDGDATAADLPRLLGRPESTAPRLVDEHDWVRYARGIEPPRPEELARWAGWAALTP
jgi:hypothetical protein